MINRKYTFIITSILLYHFAFLQSLVAQEIFDPSSCREGDLIFKTDLTLNAVTSFKQDGNDFIIVAVNKEILPIFINIQMTTLVNMKSEKGANFSVRLNTGEEKEINRLTVIDLNSHRDFRYLFRIHFSDPNLISHNAKAIYSLPIEKGTSTTILQGYKGKITHNSELNLYALDFSMPTGTKVLAARKGIVISSRSDMKQGGFLPALTDATESMGNYVMVLHDDGTVAHYYHLQCGGTSLRKGDQIEEGDLIGYSGTTGYSKTPHLHFVVRVPAAEFSYGKVTVPTLFKINSQKNIQLKEGLTYIKEY